MQQRRISVSDLINSVFTIYPPIQEPQVNSDAIPVDSTTYVIHFTDLKTMKIDSDDIFLTVTKPIKDPSTLPHKDQEALEAAKKEEIDFLMKKGIVIPVKSDELGAESAEAELQKLKWVLTIKTSTIDASKNRHRARIVSACHLSIYRHSVHGNAPTINLSTLRTVLAIIPTWMQLMPGERIVVILRDVTKAFLQADKSNRLILYMPPDEFFKYYPQFIGHIWKAIVQIYGEVEAGLYWYKTFVAWLLDNFPGLQQSVYDPSLLFIPNMCTAILLCTDDTFIAIPESQLFREEAMAKRFECRERENLPTDFKGVDVSQKDNNITISQQDYITTKGKITDLPPAPAKSEMSRPMTEEELKLHRKNAGKLAWIATATSPTSAFSASIALQGTQKPFPLLHRTAEALQHASDQELTTLTYKPLDFATIHIRVFSDGSYQNLPDKHSQIGFIICISDKDDNCNITHWHSSRASRRPTSTDESELFALDLALNRLRSHRKIIFQLLGKEIPTVVYIDNQTLWDNLMNTTATSLPEVMMRCREHISEETVNSVCLIDSKYNVADAMTKAKPNNALLTCIKHNHFCTPVKRVFMLQNSLFRHATFIPTTSVPMQDDLKNEVNMTTASPSFSSSHAAEPSSATLPQRTRADNHTLDGSLVPHLHCRDSRHSRHTSM